MIYYPLGFERLVLSIIKNRNQRPKQQLQQQEISSSEVSKQDEYQEHPKHILEIYGFEWQKPHPDKICLCGHKKSSHLKEDDDTISCCLVKERCICESFKSSTLVGVGNLEKEKQKNYTTPPWCDAFLHSNITYDQVTEKYPISVPLRFDKIPSCDELIPLVKRQLKETGKLMDNPVSFAS